MGNQGKMAGNPKICIGIHSQLILPEFIQLLLSLWKVDSILCTPDLVYCFFELVSYSFQRESIKYMNSGRISWLWIPIQIFEFPAILPWLPMMQLWAWTPLKRSQLLPELISSLLQWINMHDIITISSLLMLINILPFRTSTVYLILQRTILPHLKYEIAVLYFSQSLAFHGFRWHSGPIAQDWAAEDDLC